MSAQLITSKRKNSQIVIDNFKFSKAYEGINKVCWRCINKLCDAKVYIKNNNEVLYTEIVGTLISLLLYNN